jgi:DNA-binding transcriptional LysR family regulator
MASITRRFRPPSYCSDHYAAIKVGLSSLYQHCGFIIMDRLTSMAVFVRVADLGSFAAAAKEFRLSPTMVGKHIRHLEQRLGSLLVNRSTRRQSLTELGRNYVEHCRRVLEEIDAGEALAEETMRTPRGRIRVGSSLAFGAHALAPALVPFSEQYPEITVELELSDRIVDLVDDDLDIAIRVGPLIGSTMMARALSPYRAVVCASPDYIARRGTPHHPRDLLDHECLSFGGWAEGLRWTFVGDEGEITVEVKSRLKINNAFAIRSAALAGAGIIMQGKDLLANDIAEGRLKVLLADYKTQQRPRHVVWLQNRRLTPKLRVFIDYVVSLYG